MQVWCSLLRFDFDYDYDITLYFVLLDALLRSVMCVCLCSRVLKTTSLSGKVAGVVCKRLQGAIAVGRDVMFHFLLSAPTALTMVSSVSLRFSTGGRIEAGSFCILQLVAGLLGGLARNFFLLSKKS